MMPLAARAYANSDRRVWRKLMKVIDWLCWWEDRHCQWEWLRWRDRENRRIRFGRR